MKGLHKTGLRSLSRKRWRFPVEVGRVRRVAKEVVEKRAQLSSDQSVDGITPCELLRAVSILQAVEAHDPCAVDTVAAPLQLCAGVAVPVYGRKEGIMWRLLRLPKASHDCVHL